MDPAVKRNMWRERIEQCLSSGMPINQWCRLNKVAPSTLYSWMAKFRKQESTLFPEQTASEWIEISKEGLAASVAMVPTTRAKPVAKVSKSKKTKPEISEDAESLPTPAIRTRVNGIEMMIPAGCTQSDIESVFKAAMSL